MFAVLIILQWIVGIIFAVIVSPKTWTGTVSSTHVHVYAAVFLGGLITLLPVALALLAPGKPITRHTVAVAQMLSSALLIHLTGGRIETHFHVFGSLAFLAFYLDWKVMITATVVVAADHFLRGLFFPQSVYGVLMVQPWRFIEHAGWVVFEDIFLLRSIWVRKQELIRLEETNRTIEQKVEERTHELVLANEKAQESERLKTEFLANISHELRTPLTLTLSPLESILSGDHGAIPEEQKNLLQTMHNNASRLFQMVTGLLDFSKLEAGKVTVQREPLDVSAVTKMLLADFEPLMKQKRLYCEFKSKATAVVEMDRYLYERIVFNLMSNAVKFTPEGGKISVMAAHEDDRLTVSVTDTGHGIPESELKHLFQRFRQVEGSVTRRFEGTGLGLSLVKEFSKRLDGDVSVISEVGKGSTFSVTLRAPQTDQKATESKKTNRHVAAMQGKKYVARQQDSTLPKVLIVEDNPEMSSYIASQLESLVQLRIAEDGEEGLTAVQEWYPDLVLSDVMMPKKDGFTLCRDIKFNPQTSHIPVVLLTALTHRDALLKGWEAGANEYLYKPFHPKELITRITSMLTLVQLTKQRKKMETAFIQSEKLSLIGQLAATVAHEINNPLTGILTVGQILEQETPSNPKSTLKEDLRLIVDSAERCQHVVKSLLGFSRTCNFGAKLTSVSDALSGILPLLQLEISKNGIEIIKELSPAAPQVQATIVELQQVLANLIMNAVQAMPAGGKLKLSTSQPDAATLEIRVQDSGPGIPPDYIDKIFDPFFTTKPTGEGTGMGLAICQKIIVGFNGSLRVESELGKGATFIAALPTVETRVSQ